MSFTTKPLPKPSRNPINTINTRVNELTNPQSPGLSEKQKNKSIERDLSPDMKPERSKEKQHPKGNILHISNICPKLTYEQIKKKLYDLFSIHGPIYEIVIKTKESGQHFAFVDFPNINDAEKAWRAFKDQPKKLENRVLVVNYCEDPKKNDDRKDQKCFLCHGTGHKAIRCPVKPEMIKQKPKKSEECHNMSEDETNFVEPGKGIKISPVVPEQSISTSSQSSEEEIRERDPDYLRFLKMKKKILERKLNKKVKKGKKKRN